MLSVLIALLLLAGSLLYVGLEHGSGFSGDVKEFLLKRLVHVEYLPAPSNQRRPISGRAVYLLGGGQVSLEKKFAVASDLYHKRIIAKILFLSRPGITEYSPQIGRNLTNDEWALGKLGDLGIPTEAMEPVEIEMGSFGTLSEAEGIARIAANRGYDELVLVTAPHHTMRAWLSFSEYLKGHHVQLYVYPSDENAGLGELLLENMKSLFYENVLLSRTEDQSHT